ncbi:MAG: AzlC family ABC transporter permease [Lachnospiraceae bacterium]|nr:AzlC family ABC transporter permease [Lachnospiraceae bacterium]
MRTTELREGIRDGIPICLGYISVSMAFGLTAVKSGMPIWATVLISLTNLTSAGQFAGTNLLVAHGSYLELAITTFIINIRYFLMSLSVSQKVEKNFGTKERLISSFGITDEVFAVSMQRRKELSFPYMVGLIATPIFGWSLGTLIGAVATSLLPEALSDAMGIALYGMFIAIIVPPAREHKNILFAVILAILASYAFTYIPILSVFSGGWSVIIITIAVSALTAWVFPIQEE